MGITNQLLLSVCLALLAQGQSVPMPLLAVAPAYSFKVAYGSTATNVGWVTNWVSPWLGRATTAFCVTMVRARDSQESLCANSTCITSSTQPVVKVLWDKPTSVSVPFTNTVTVGGVFESSTNLKAWETAFAFTEKTLTNPTAATMFYRLRATMTRP